MKKFVILTVLLLGAFAIKTSAQKLNQATIIKRESRKNLVIKEWNTNARTQTRWLDRVTTYDEFGRKIEEIEYASYGQKWRETYEYDEKGFLVKEVYYDDRNKPVYIRKFEYNEDGTKKKQYNYNPRGRLETVKVFEYIVQEP